MTAVDSREGWSPLPTEGVIAVSESDLTVVVPEVFRGRARDPVDPGELADPKVKINGERLPPRDSSQVAQRCKEVDEKGLPGILTCICGLPTALRVAEELCRDVAQITGNLRCDDEFPDQRVDFDHVK